MHQIHYRHSGYRMGNTISMIPTPAEEEGEEGYEDFTTYTLVDDGLSHAPPTATKLTITDLYTEWNTAYLYYDFGAAYFQPDFVINFEFCVTEDNSEDSADNFGIIGCSNLLGTMLDWVVENGQAPAVYWSQSFTEGYGHIELSVGDLGEAMSFTTFPWSPATVFYCTLTRVSAEAPGNCSVWLDVYSDAERTIRMTNSDGNPSGQYGRNDIPSTDGLTTHRYLNVGTSERPSFDNDPCGSYYVQNVEIISNG